MALAEGIEGAKGSAVFHHSRTTEDYLHPKARSSKEQPVMIWPPTGA